MLRSGRILSSRTFGFGAGAAPVGVQDDPLPGSRAVSSKLRDQWSKELLVNDQLAIPKSLKLTTHVPCWKLHPGVCVTKDAWCYGEIVFVARQLDNYLFSEKKVCLISHGASAADLATPKCGRSFTFAIRHFRFANDN